MHVTEQSGQLKGTTSSIARVTIGLLLLVASSLKGYHLVTDASQWLPGSTAGVGGWLFPWPYLALVVLETSLGVALLANWRPHPLRVITIGLFLAFAVVSFALGITGRSRCACFGPVSVSPWWTLTLDMACVLALLLTRPVASRARQQTSLFAACTASVRINRPGRRALRLAGLVLGVCVLLITAGTLRFGSVAHAVYAFQGYRVIPDAWRVRLDAGSGVVTFTLRNYTPTPVTVTGVQTSCGLQKLTRLPQRIPPHGACRLQFNVAASANQSGRKAYAVRVFVDVPSPPIVLAIHAGT
ncbi:MAG: hypothetical protein KatS3mg110_1465 [Pirellulaceae bacterium]|nr:MAG: hypothetical protein KatS3mg110_1465 [Pirellulaceae bacterium]